MFHKRLPQGGVYCWMLQSSASIIVRKCRAVSTTGASTLTRLTSSQLQKNTVNFLAVSWSRRRWCTQKNSQYGNLLTWKVPGGSVRQRQSTNGCAKRTCPEPPLAGYTAHQVPPGKKTCVPNVYRDVLQAAAECTPLKADGVVEPVPLGKSRQLDHTHTNLWRTTGCSR